MCDSGKMNEDYWKGEKKGCQRSCSPPKQETAEAVPGEPGAELGSPEASFQSWGWLSCREWAGRKGQALEPHFLAASVSSSVQWKQQCLHLADPES